MITIGVDPGLSGALAMLRDGVELLHLSDMPTVEGAGVVKRIVDAPALRVTLLDALHAHFREDESIKALVERTSAMPGQGVSSMYSMGHSRGVVEGVLAGCGVEFYLVPPADWKRNMGYTADKEPIRREMQRLYPSADLKFKKHADRAEALAMALYLHRQLKNNF